MTIVISPRKVMFSKEDQKVKQIFGLLLCKPKLSSRISKIVQSGHTAWNVIERKAITTSFNYPGTKYKNGMWCQIITL